MILRMADGSKSVISLLKKGIIDSSLFLFIILTKFKIQMK